jgi:hypothetical protein
MLKRGVLAGLVAGLALLVLYGPATHAAVDLAYFMGRWDGSIIRLTWGTGSEVDHAGFHLWRSTENLPIVDGQIDRSRATRLSDSPILSPVVCPPAGYDYDEFVDAPPAPLQDTYYYYLESANCGGGSEFNGDATNTGGLAVSPIGAGSPTPTATRTVTATATRWASHLHLPLISRR